jgi:hypothetical protein
MLTMYATERNHLESHIILCELEIEILTQHARAIFYILRTLCLNESSRHLLYTVYKQETRTHQQKYFSLHFDQ